MEPEITKREILFSVVIVAVMMTIGFMIHGAISNNLNQKQQIYNTALQIDNSKEQFVYGMNTDIGNSFVFGQLKAVDTVTYPEIGGQYSYIKKNKEEYTMHTRTVTETDSEGKTHTRTETYYSWDLVSSESLHCNKISFCEVEFPYGTIQMPSSSYITTQHKAFSDIRYVYYGCGTSYTGTLFAELKNHTINHVKYYNGMTIPQTLKHLNSKAALVGFWIIWIFITIIIVYLFYAAENKWLENN